MARPVPLTQIDAVRQFNRFYTRHIGLLEEHLLASPFTLTQARVLFELGTRDTVTAREIGDELGLDRGYLSRILHQFAKRGFIKRRKSAEDGRKALLSLSTRGRKTFESLDRLSHDGTAAVLHSLPATRRRRLLGAMQTIELVLGAAPARGTVRIRTHRIGDIGWAIECHARLYSQEYAWNEEFEALVATLFAGFAAKHDPQKERCWIAEAGDERAGCVFLVQNADDPEAAQLRCLLVDPAWRGSGIGRRLVDECLGFAKQAGYRRMVLWTNDVLVSARRIYEHAGFTLSREERHHSFGHDLIGQTWIRDL